MKDKDLTAGAATATPTARVDAAIATPTGNVDAAAPPPAGGRYAKVVLIDFARSRENSLLLGWRRLRWRFHLSRRQIGRIRSYEVEYLELPWQESDFAALPLEQQRRAFFRILKAARERGAYIAGMPMHWRSVLGNRAPLMVADGRPLAIDCTLRELAAQIDGLAGRQVAVIGVDDRREVKLIDRLLEEGAFPVLTGKGAKAIADSYYRRQGLALPVFRSSFAIGCSDGVLFLAGTSAKTETAAAVCFGDRPVRVSGSWLEPFESGCFSCGLAAALAAVGGEIELSSPEQEVLDKKPVFAV